APVDPQRRVGRAVGDRIAQIGADVEQLVLDPREQRCDVVAELGEREGGPDRAVGFVHVGVGDQARVGLGHPAQVTERGRPVVTGSAGCVLAARLSEDPATRVLLLEAGPPDDADEIHIPAALNLLFQSTYDWDYRTVPQERAAGRAIYWPRGRTLGGSSSMNA